MTTKHRTHKQRGLLVGLAVVASSAALALGFAVLHDDESDFVSVDSVPTTGSTSTTLSTATTESTATSTATGSTQPSGTETRTTPTRNDTGAVGGQDDQTQAGTTEDCRADPDCASSEHRTSDPCGAAIIVDTDGYLEGRRDAEQGLSYQIDNAPAPGPADNDDDDGTVGPETQYRAGYAQGWCDGEGMSIAG